VITAVKRRKPSPEICRVQAASQVKRSVETLAA
jgi:hypothetical protein